MTSPLVRLRDAIVAGEVKGRDDLSVLDYGRFYDLWSAIDDPHPHGLEEAIYLLDAWLPGWGWTIGTARPDNHFAKLWGPPEYPGPFFAVSKTASTALLLACLAALIEKETT
jgi:hypothetical protein